MTWRYVHYRNLADPSSPEALCGKSANGLTRTGTGELVASALLIITKGKDLTGFTSYLKAKPQGPHGTNLLPCPACLKREPLVLLAHIDLE